MISSRILLIAGCISLGLFNRGLASQVTTGQSSSTVPVNVTTSITSFDFVFTWVQDVTPVEYAETSGNMANCTLRGTWNVKGLATGTYSLRLWRAALKRGHSIVPIRDGSPK